MKIYHQKGAEFNISNQVVYLIFGGNNNYHQIGNAYLEFDLTVRKHKNDVEKNVGDKNMILLDW